MHTRIKLKKKPKSKTNFFTRIMTVLKNPPYNFVDFRESIPEAYKPQISPMINKGLIGLAASLDKAGNKEAANFVTTKLPAPKK